MFIKKYRGKDVNLLQQQVIDELGPYAVILVTRTIEPSFFERFFKDYEYEISVGVESEDYYHHQTDMKKLEPAGAAASIPETDALITNLHSFDWQTNEAEAFSVAVTGPIRLNPNQKNLISFVGPDTVNKPAVVTKLALKLQRESTAKVAMIASGTYNDQSDEQLRGFAQIFKFSYEKIANEKELIKFIESNPNCHIFFLAATDRQSVPELKAMTKQMAVSRVLLVLEVSLSMQEQLNLIHHYESLELFGLIYTGFESNPSLLFLEDITKKHSVPISYLLEGSDVKVANADDLETRIINEKLRTLSTTW